MPACRTGLVQAAAKEDRVAVALRVDVDQAAARVAQHDSPGLQLLEVALQRSGHLAQPLAWQPATVVGGLLLHRDDGLVLGQGPLVVADPLDAHLAGGQEGVAPGRGGKPRVSARWGTGKGAVTRPGPTQPYPTNRSMNQPAPLERTALRSVAIPLHFPPKHEGADKAPERQDQQQVGNEFEKLTKQEDHAERDEDGASRAE